MPFFIVRNDITKMNCDAIVNAANETLLGGGGVDGAIHAAAGPELLAECRTLGGCPTGQARLTRGYRLPAKYVIHTVGPVWQGGDKGERDLLTACYENSLALAAERGLETVAFPLISAGVYGYPKDQALEVASAAIRRFLEAHEMTVWLVLFNREVLHLGQQRFSEIRSYVHDHYVNLHEDLESTVLQRRRQWFPNGAQTLGAAPTAMPKAAEAPREGAVSAAQETPFDPAELRKMLRERDESFSQMLLRKIDERGWTDAYCYKKANVDRKHFSKIRSDINYRPGKPTAIAFALALELSPAEARDLLRKAGYALSPSSPFDIIIDYYLKKGIYDVFQINETLFAYDQPLIG